MKRLLLALAFLLSAAASHAATFSYTAAAGNWSTASNWSSSAVAPPGAGAVVDLVNSAVTLDVSTSALSSLTASGSGVLTDASSFTVTAGTLQAGTNSLISFTGTGASTAGTVVASSILAYAGTNGLTNCCALLLSGTSNSATISGATIAASANYPAVIDNAYYSVAIPKGLYCYGCTFVNTSYYAVGPAAPVIASQNGNNYVQFSKFGGGSSKYPGAAQVMGPWGITSAAGTATAIGPWGVTIDAGGNTWVGPYLVR